MTSSSNHYHVYSEIQRSLADLLLIALCSGGDYYTGLQGCGVKTALALVQCGFADSLYHAATSLPPTSLPVFLDEWCDKVISELATDLHGCIGRKMTSLASTVPQIFPTSMSFPLMFSRSPHFQKAVLISTLISPGCRKSPQFQKLLEYVNFTSSGVSKPPS